MPRSAGTVLGIDAAWTDGEPSGVALLERRDSRWRCLRVAASYARFCEGADFAGTARGSLIDVSALLRACSDVSLDASVNVVAVDMPLARSPIHSRRTADQVVSRHFGHCGASVHSPTTERPGATGERLRAGFESAGYALKTEGGGAGPALIEVYPHVALLALMEVPKRLPYKAAKSTKYWPGVPLAERKVLLVEEWRAIESRLSKEVDRIHLPLPDDASALSLRQLKALEDALDALICAWVGMQFLDGRANPLGDDDAAIWVPSAALAFGRPALAG